MCLQQEKGSAKTNLGDDERTEIHLGAFVQFPILHTKISELQPSPTNTFMVSNEKVS